MSRIATSTALLPLSGAWPRLLVRGSGFGLAARRVRVPMLPSAVAVAVALCPLLSRASPPPLPGTLAVVGGVHASVDASVLSRTVHRASAGGVFRKIIPWKMNQAWPHSPARAHRWSPFGH